MGKGKAFESIYKKRQLVRFADYYCGVDVYELRGTAGKEVGSYLFEFLDASRTEKCGICHADQ